MRVVIFGFALLLSMGLSAAPGFSSLEERMTGQEFRESGLHKLSDEELAALNRWIRQRSLAEGQGQALAGADGVVAEDRRGLRDGGPDRDRAPIRSRIVGSFSGWDGSTEFELENGQVWRQTQAGTFAIRETENPEVEIRPGMFNSWNLRVNGYNRRVAVERIR